MKCCCDWLNGLFCQTSLLFSQWKSGQMAFTFFPPRYCFIHPSVCLFLTFACKHTSARQVFKVKHHMKRYHLKFCDSRKMVKAMVVELNAGGHRINQLLEGERYQFRYCCLMSPQTFGSSWLSSSCDAWPTQRDRVYIQMSFCPAPLHFTVSLTFRSRLKSISAGAIMIIGTKEMEHKHKYNHRGWSLACKTNF